MFAVLSLTGSNEQAKPKLALQSGSTAADTAKSNKVTDEPPSIPLPSPMNDPTWLEYVEHSGLMGVGAELPMGLGMRPRNNTNPLPLMAPEITHLRSNSTTAAVAAMRRPSLENLGALPKVQQMLSRRSPKTRYAQQQKEKEQQQQQRNRSQDHGRLLKKKASVELIAEQYRAMLDYKDRLEEGFVYDEDEEAPPVPEKDDVTVEPELPLLQPRKFSGGNGSSSHSRSRSPGERVSPRTRTPPQREVILERPPVVAIEDAGDMSPQSDCTLIGFEEDVIYFKPVSFGPSPPASPRPEARQQRKKSADRGRTPPPPRTQKEARQLDIGLDLLHGELSSSLARGGCHRRQSEDRLSDLQLTIMIDAYESLRERTRTMELADGDRENMARMFESWVSTLHNIRGSLVTRGGLI